LVPEEGGARGIDSWVALNYDFIRIALAGLALLILFMTGLDWIPVIVVGAVLAAAFWWLAGARDRGAAAGTPEPEPMVDPAPGV
jgi:hypothetical protein